MELFICYLLRASVLMVLFYAFYRLFFAHNTFHAINRFLLVSILPMVTLLPLFRFNLFPEKMQEAVSGLLLTNLSVSVVEFTETEPQIEIPWIQMLTLLFVVGSLFTVVHYLIGLSRIAAIIRESERQMLAGQTVLCVSNKKISPFSWMKYIVISHSEATADKQAVIRHEKAHIRLGHSFDMIFFDLFTALFWFNPFSWLLRREIRSVHEYQADNQVISNGFDTKQYQLLLIRKSVGEYKFALANNFRRRNLQKRITMMKKNRTNKQMKWCYAMLIPVLFLSAVVLSVPELNAKAVEKENNSSFFTTENSANPIQKNDDELLTKGRSLADRPANPTQMNDDRQHNMVSDSISDKRITADSKRLSLGNISGNTSEIQSSGANKPLIILDGTVISNAEMQKIAPDDIESISVLKDNAAVSIYGEKGEHGVILIKTKNSNRDGKPAAAVSIDSLRGRVKEVTLKTKDNNSQTTVWSVENPPLIIVDGKRMPLDFQLNSIDPSDIKSISVLKDSKALESYGDEGKNGVVIITKKKDL